MDILEEIILNKEKEVSLLKKSFPVEDLLTGIKNKKYIKRNFHESLLEKKTTNIIAEIKKASPSKGIILEDFQPLKIALEYELGGASAISILTDEPFFKGKIDYIDFPEGLADSYQPYTKASMKRSKNIGYSNKFKTLETGVEEYLTWLNF